MYCNRRATLSRQRRVAILAPIALSLAGFAQTSPTSVSIVSPANGTIIIADQPVNISVGVTNISPTQGVQLVSSAFGISNPVVQAPYTFSVVFPDTSIGSPQVTAMIITAPGSALFSMPITISVVPASSLQSLAVNTTSVAFSFVGDAARIRATGTFTGGVAADISGLSSTRFSSQNAAVAKVDGAGNVVATGSGKTNITVQNGSLSATVAVSVPATIRGDLNADGKVDQDDLNILLAAIGTPVTGPFDARDLNGDGVIDTKDAQVLESLCSSTCVPGGHIIPVTGVVNAASFVANSVAPGELFSVFTSGLSVPTLSATTIPFPNSLGGVTVQVGGIGIPLLYVSPTQINAQMPYEVAPGQATLAVVVNGSSSLPIPLTIAASAPGLFTFPGGRGIVQNQDYTLNSATNPAKVGSVIVAYFTGQGALDTVISSGNPAPSNSLVRTTSVTSATIGGLSAQVLFSGLTPGFVGLAQANIVVPSLPTGDYPLAIAVGGFASNAAIISVAH